MAAAAAVKVGKLYGFPRIFTAGINRTRWLLASKWWKACCT
jgi:hypothetical protein